VLVRRGVEGSAPLRHFCKRITQRGFTICGSAKPQVDGHVASLGCGGPITQRAPQTCRSRGRNGPLQTICKPSSPIRDAREIVFGALAAPLAGRSILPRAKPHRYPIPGSVVMIVGLLGGVGFDFRSELADEYSQHVDVAGCSSRSQTSRPQSSKPPTVGRRCQGSSTDSDSRVSGEPGVGHASTVAQEGPSEGGQATSGASLVTPMGHVPQAVTGSLLVLMPFVVSCQGTETAKGRPESVPRIGELAPAFALPSAEGGQVSVRDFQGRSPVLLYFSMGPG
jgi:hypothetical protein